MKSSTVVVTVIGALIVGFVGGILGGILSPKSGGDTASLESRLSAVESKVSGLESRVGSVESQVSGLSDKISSLSGGQGTGLKVAYVDAEGLFIKVFIPQVQSEREAVNQKQQEIQKLQGEYVQGKIKQDEYQQKAAQLQVELLKAQLKVDLDMLDKMIASAGFADFRGDLQKIKQQAQPLVDELDNLYQTAKVGIVDMQSFLSRYQQLQSAFQQLDQLLTKAAAAKIVVIAQKVAKEKGFDLVVRKKDVIIYYDPNKVIDISGDVETQLWKLFTS
jgi:chromosome segregation ATPase